jgi:hypothetical protein
MASVAFHPNVSSVGASGAVFGIIGALFGLLLHARDAVPPTRLQQLRSGIIAFVILNLMFGLSVQGIDNAAHVGGAVAGLLAGMIVVPARAAGHWLRIGLLAVVGTGVILLSSRFLPPPPRDFVTASKQFEEKQRQILGKYNELNGKLSQGVLSEREFADQLETEVVVPWRELAKETSQTMKEGHEADRQAKIEKYMRLRQESFEDLLAAVREDDEARLAQSKEKAEEARKIVNELNVDEEKER